MAKETITTQYNVGDFAVAVDMIRKAQRNLYYVANTTLIDLCIKERLKKRELDRQITSCMYERSILSPIKLAPMVREIAPQAEKIFRDTYVMEFITGEEAKPENSLRKAMLHKMKKLIFRMMKKANQ